MQLVIKIQIKTFLQEHTALTQEYSIVLTIYDYINKCCSHMTALTKTLVIWMSVKLSNAKGTLYNEYYQIF